MSRARWRVAALTGLVVIACEVMAQGPVSGAPSSAVPSVTNPTQFVDNFDNGQLSGWTKYDEAADAPSDWQVSDKALRQTAHVVEPDPGDPGDPEPGAAAAAADAIERPGTLLVAGNPAWRDLDYTVDLGDGSSDVTGVVFRLVDAANYYRFSIDQTSGRQQLVKKVAGQYTLLADRAAPPHDTGTAYRTRVQTRGTRLRVLVGGAPVFDVRDPDLTSGRVGVYSSGAAGASFDNVRVSFRDDSFFTIAVIPDTQHETQDFPEQFVAQTRYLAENRASLNLAAVLHEGDVVDEAWDDVQWGSASTAMSHLDGKVPFVVAAGNHDLMSQGDKPPITIWPQAFNSFMTGISPQPATAFRTPGDFRNSYTLFRAGGVAMMVLNLEFGAPDPVLRWAGAMADAHPHRHVVMLTHDYLGKTTWRRPGNRNLPTALNPGLNNGIDIWREFVKRHRNVQFTFNGHVIVPNPGTLYSVGRLVSRNDAGRRVFQTLTNYQKFDPGGRGYLRLFRFYPSQRKVTVRTFSPYLQTYLDDPLNKFTYTSVNLGNW